MNPSLPFSVAFICFLLGHASAGSASAESPEAFQPFFEKHCVQCHGEEKQKSGVRLDDASTLDALGWEEVYEQLANGEMPPDDELQPSEEERDRFLKWALTIAKLDSDSMPTGFRRLNKREYGNTVKDLLGLSKGVFDPGEYIYGDEINEGFDTNAEELVISNELLLEYLNAAEKSLRLALFSASREKPAAEVIDVETRRMRGGSSRYVSFANDHMILRVGGTAKVYNGDTSTRVVSAPGRYRITVTASGIDRDRYPVKFYPEEGPLILGVGVIADALESVTSGGTLLTSFELEDNKENTFEFETWIDKGHYPYLSFVNGSGKPITQIRSNIRRRKIPASAAKQPFVGPGIRVSEYKIEGPFNEEWPPESFKVTFDSETIPDFESVTERWELLNRFATRAFRRPVEKAELELYWSYLKEQHTQNGNWHESLLQTFAAMMASVDFLYLREESGELDAIALANRLSYFLWSTMPDRELFDLAISGQLKSPEVLAAQVARLLDDRRALRFSQGYADQWLSLDKLGTMPPDGKGEYRIYYRENLEPAMLEETRRFFHYVLQENRSVRDFIHSDYSFLNQGLANLYGVPFEGGTGFVQVSLPAESGRGGLLGHGSILSLTSNGVETSPVERGHWVLDELLGTPPPPAPKEIPALVPDLNGATTVREQLEKHRSDATCYECHRQMDPLGFALEAFNPIGGRRTIYENKQEVTTYGNYKGQDFEDLAGLKEIMLRDVRPFARNLVVKIAEYAKGRRLVASDFEAIETLVDEVSANDYPLRDIVSEVATGELMRMR